MGEEEGGVLAVMLVHRVVVRVRGRVRVMWKGYVRPLENKFLINVSYKNFL